MTSLSSHKGVSAEYLSKALASKTNNSALQIETVLPVGTGQMAESYRVKLASNFSFGSSVIVKVPSQNQNSRAASKVTRCYELETSFYSSLLRHVRVDAPECLHVWYEGSTDDFVLVLEDIFGSKQGDQIRGATFDQASAAIDQLVKLHSPLWGAVRLNEFTWLPTHSAKSEKGTADLLRSAFPNFASRFADVIDAKIIRVGERLVAGIEKYNLAFPSVATVAHRDFRLDNLLFSEVSGQTSVKVVDWQTVAALPGVSDLSYFIGASFLPDDRRRYEHDLVSRYQAGLHASGIELDFNDLWAQYRLFATSGYIMAIVASVLVKQTDRGDAMFAAMASRHGQQMLDLETEKFFA